MSLAPYTVGVCATPLPAYTCNPCPTTEKARVGSVAFLVPGFSFINPLDPLEWIQAIQDGNVIMIPKTRGKYDGGSVKKGDGYGRERERTMFYDFQMDFKDLNLYPNASFYDTLDKTLDYTVIFFTGKLMWMVTTPVTISTKDAVTENVEDDVVWEVMCTWQDIAKPRKFIAPAGITACFQPA